LFHKLATIHSWTAQINSFTRRKKSIFTFGCEFFPQVKTKLRSRGFAGTYASRTRQELAPEDCSESKTEGKKQGKSSCIVAAIHIQAIVAKNTESKWLIILSEEPTISEE
jgi:hypothetical protein